jgi:hypothetical protein
VPASHRYPRPPGAPDTCRTSNMSAHNNCPPSTNSSMGYLAVATICAMASMQPPMGIFQRAHHLPSHAHNVSNKIRFCTKPAETACARHATAAGGDPDRQCPPRLRPRYNTPYSSCSAQCSS